jgi:hypothetical protein
MHTCMLTLVCLSSFVLALLSCYRADHRQWRLRGSHTGAVFLVFSFLLSDSLS